MYQQWRTAGNNLDEADCAEAEDVQVQQEEDNRYGTTKFVFLVYIHHINIFFVFGSAHLVMSQKVSYVCLINKNINFTRFLFCSLINKR